MASARRRLRQRLAAELMERQRIEARINERSAYLRMMYNYPRPSTAAIIDPAMRLADSTSRVHPRVRYHLSPRRGDGGGDLWPDAMNPTITLGIVIGAAAAMS
jgi:hypothetical protein